MSKRTTDPRLLRILELLGELIEDRPSEDLASPLQSEDEPPQWSQADLWLTSATDLLVPWTPSALAADDQHGFRTGGNAAIAPDAAGRNGWDEYLEQREHTGRIGSPGPDDESLLPRPPAGRSSWSPSPIIVEPDAIDPAPIDTRPHELRDDIAQSATDCLFDFIHALGRHDVDAAMSQVAQDFHTIQDDREIDRETLRLKLEYFLDQRKSGDFSLSIGRVPEPMHHPLGVLIHVTFQADYSPYDGGAKETTVEERVALLCEQSDGSWLIGGLAPVGT